MQKRLILHVGAPKCGSSALQTYLSSLGEFETPKIGRAGYGLLQAKGGLITDAERIRRQAENSPFGYRISQRFTHLPNTAEFARLLEHGFDAGFASKDTIVLSCEGWIGESNAAAAVLALVPDSVEVDVLAWIRPAVDAANSGWWQWGAWTEQSLDQFIARSEPGRMHAPQLQQWAENVNSLSVIPLHQADIIEDVNALFGIERASHAPDSERRSNRSLPGSVLRLYQRHRHLRPGPHESRNDFILEQFVEGDRTPWVIPLEHVQRILGHAQHSLDSLRPYIPDCYWSRIDSVAKWTDPSAYMDKITVPWSRQEVPNPELDHLTAQLATAVVGLYEENLRLKSGAARSQSRPSA